jgi:DNA gyrase subunit A
MATKHEDEVWRLFVASTHATMLFFTSTGRVFARKVHELPDVGPAARGRALVNLLQLGPDETVRALLPIRDFSDHDEAYLFFATRQGRVKRTLLSDYANIRANGLKAVAINDGDDLLAVRLTRGDRHVFLGTNQGMGIRFAETDVRPMGRTAAGVRGVNLREGDFVEEVAIFDPVEDKDILVVTELGYGKRTPISEFRVQGRGGYGMKLIRLTQKTGAVAAIRHVSEDDEVMVVTEGGMLIRTRVSELRRIGRATMGVRIIRLDEGDRVVAVARADMLEDGDDVDDRPAVDGAASDVAATDDAPDGET